MFLTIVEVEITNSISKEGNSVRERLDSKINLLVID